MQLGADSAVQRIVEEKKEENAKELMEMAMKQFDDQERALEEEKKKLQMKMQMPAKKLDNLEPKLFSLPATKSLIEKFLTVSLL